MQIQVKIQAAFFVCIMPFDRCISSSTAKGGISFMKAITRAMAEESWPGWPSRPGG